MNKQQAAVDIVAHALPLVPFDGWRQSTLQKAAVSAGYKKTDVIRVFPGGAIEAVNAFSRQADGFMLKTLENHPFETMKIRERIAAAVRARLEIVLAHREAVRKAAAMQALPVYALHGLRNVYATVDAIWHAAGDRSTDFNFYTKRLLLSGVYASTLLAWLDDPSPGQEQAWKFLDRRIADVMRIEKAKQQFKKWAA